MPRKSFEQGKRENQRSEGRSSGKKLSFRKRAADAPTFDACPPPLIHAIVCLCTTYGASPTFSYTRDGTSLVVAVYHEGERYVDYLSGPDELAEWFAWLTTELLEVDPKDLDSYVFLAPKKA